MSKVGIRASCQAIILCQWGSTFDGTLGFRLAVGTWAEWAWGITTVCCYGVLRTGAEGEKGPAIVQCFLVAIPSNLDVSLTSNIDALSHTWDTPYRRSSYHISIVFCVAVSRPKFSSSSLCFFCVATVTYSWISGRHRGTSDLRSTVQTLVSDDAVPGFVSPPERNTNRRPHEHCPTLDTFCFSTQAIASSLRIIAEPPDKREGPCCTSHDPATRSAIPTEPHPSFTPI